MVGDTEAPGAVFIVEMYMQYRKCIVGTLVGTLVGTPQCFWLFVGDFRENRIEKRKQKSTDFKRINVKIGAFGGVREI